MSVKCSLGRLYRHMRSCRFPPYGPCGQIGRDGTPEPLSTQATGLAISARTKQLRHLVGPTFSPEDDNRGLRLHSSGLSGGLSIAKCRALGRR
jgi:hypothetical protein